MSSEHHHFSIGSKTPPTVELDSAARSVYVRFKKTAVAKTVPQHSEHMHIAVDLDSSGQVVGIEAVGITNFTLHALLKSASVKAPNMDFSRARFETSDLVQA